jgi:hypothetical protein
MTKKPTATKKPAAEKAPAEVTAPAVEAAEIAQAEPAPSPSMPSAPEATPDGAREPWPVRLEKMSRDEIQTLLQGNTLGERKRAEAKARLASL